MNKKDNNQRRMLKNLQKAQRIIPQDHFKNDKIWSLKQNIK